LPTEGKAEGKGIMYKMWVDDSGRVAIVIGDSTFGKSTRKME